MNPENLRWLIWSPEHGAWWGRQGNGYTKSRADAGRFSFAEARDHVMTPGNETDLPEDTLLPEEPR